MNSDNHYSCSMTGVSGGYSLSSRAILMMITATTHPILTCRKIQTMAIVIMAIMAKANRLGNINGRPNHHGKV